MPNSVMHFEIPADDVARAKALGWISAFKDPENNIIGLHEMPAPPPQKAAAKRAPKSATKKKRK